MLPAIPSDIEDFHVPFFDARYLLFDTPSCRVYNVLNIGNDFILGKRIFMDTNIRTQSSLTTEQKEMIFENMSDGIITVNAEGIVTYMNSAFARIFHISVEDVLGKAFKDVFLKNKKNKAFNRLLKTSIEKGTPSDKTNVRYRIGDDMHYLTLDISLIQSDPVHSSSTLPSARHPFQGMVLLVEDITDRRRLKQHEHDCAYIFAGLIICISLYLFAWRFIHFTLHIYLKNSYYTWMIEGITFLLFLEIIFCTSFSMRGIGIIPNLSHWKQNLKESVLTGAIVCIAILLAKLILMLCGIKIKAYFIGGSWHGAYTYLFTAFIQEFLARGVIQTSVKSLMKVKYQKQFSILLTSLLFSLMHMPFGFYFMFGAFILSLALGTIYERQKDIWGCALLHWGCGYLAMSLFF